MHITTVYCTRRSVDKFDYFYYIGLASGDFRLSIQGSHDSKITIIFIPLKYAGRKIHVCVLKILGLAMPLHMSTFHQDFPQFNF